MGQDNANEQPPPPPPTVWQRLGERIRNTPGSGVAFAVIPLVILGYFGWYYYGAKHLDQTLYALKLENVELSPQPPWIHGDVKAKVFQSNQLSKVSLLEPQATATIAHAFDAHSWVKHTNYVRKLSGGKVVVDVTYRRPAAMVFADQFQADGANTKGSKRYCWAVDEEGFMLDSEDFAHPEVPNYFMIFAPNAVPSGKIGMAFGDPRIAEALALCKLLEPLRAELRLACIYVEPDSIDLQLGGFNSWVLNVVTRDNREVIWGHSPGRETKDELLVEEKLAAMKAWLSAPAASSPIAVLDLRQRRGLGQRLTSTPSVTIPPTTNPPPHLPPSVALPQSLLPNPADGNGQRLP